MHVTVIKILKKFVDVDYQRWHIVKVDVLKHT